MSAYARVAAAIALAVSAAVLTVPATAADLYEPPYNEYGEGPPPPRDDRYAEVPDDFEPPYPEPGYDRGRCIPREVARDRLREAGWYDFHAVEPRGGVVLVKARRGRDRLFDLTIDRCSGEVVDAQPLGGGRRWGDYAFGPRRHWAPY